MSLSAKLVAMLGLDAKGFAAGLTDAKEKTNTFAATMRNLGRTLIAGFSFAAIGAGLKAMVSEGIRNILDMVDAAERVGMSFEKWQRLSVHMKEAGVESSSVEQAMNRIRVAMDEVAQGNEAAVKKFQALGIAAGDVIGTGGDVAAMLELVAAKSVDSQGNLVKLAEVSDLIGSKVGPKMANALRDVAGGIDAVGRVSVDANTARNIEVLADSWDQVKMNIAGAVATAVVFFQKQISGVKDSAQGDDLLSEKMKARLAGQKLLADEAAAVAVIEARIAEEKLKQAGPSAQIAALEEKRAAAVAEAADARALYDRVTETLAIEKQVKLEAQLVELKRRQADEQERAWDAAEKANEDLFNTLDELNKIEAGRAEIADRRTFSPFIPQADTLARVGGFMGAAVSPQFATAARQLQVQQEQLAFDKQNSERQAKLLADLGSKMASLADAEDKLAEVLSE